MSRIGKLPVPIPEGVKVNIAGRSITISGPKGELQLTYSPFVKVELRSEALVVSKQGRSEEAPKHYGLIRSLLFNMVQGVSQGFEKHLEIHGVGYRAQVSGRKLTLSVGFSHTVEYQLPEGVEATVEGNLITLKGIDKQLVGQAAAEVRAIRKPEPYKGKGIRYQDEHVRRKAGKTASAGGAK